MISVEIQYVIDGRFCVYKTGYRDRVSADADAANILAIGFWYCHPDDVSKRETHLSVNDVRVVES